MKRFYLFLFFISSIVLFQCKKISAQTDSVCINIATNSIQWFKNSESEKIVKHFDDIVSQKLSKETVALIWTQLCSQLGEYEKIDTQYTKKYSSGLLIETILKFQNDYIKYRLSFEENDKINGIFFIPYKKHQIEGKDVDNEHFSETTLEFKNDGIAFPAKLCLPKQQNTQCIVVFVHGSGPNDMDESIGPNKIFEQMAHQLAEKGIASFRYHKRTYLSQQNNIDPQLTTDIHNIVVNDAVAAIKYISLNEKTKHIPVYIIGHSLGAHLAPLIANKSGIVKGIIMMAANARPIEDVILDQTKYLFSRGGITKVERKEIRKVRKQCRNVKKLEKSLKKGKEKELPVFSTAFWLSLNEYDALKEAKSINLPILILQGERDYQVNMKDFYIWKKNLDIKNVDFISYPKLNHLFISGEEESFPEEYQNKGFVSKKLISDISNWLVTSLENKVE